MSTEGVINAMGSTPPNVFARESRSNGSGGSNQGDGTRSLSVWVVGLAVLLVVGLGGLFVVDRLFNPDKFQIEEIAVRGEFKHVAAPEVEAVIRSYLVGNYFSISLERLEKQVEELPWVFSASLRRVWPSTVQVEVVEIQPLARWGEDRWVNFTGDLVARLNGFGDSDLPKILGPVSQKDVVWKNFNLWSDHFSAHGLRLRELKLEHGHLWTLGVSLGALAASDNGADQAQVMALRNHVVDIVVENQDAEMKIERLIDVLKHKSIWSFGSIESIDLRYPNGFAIAWLDQPLVEGVESQ